MRVRRPWHLANVHLVELSQGELVCEELLPVTQQNSSVLDLVIHSLCISPSAGIISRLLDLGNHSSSLSPDSKHHQKQERNQSKLKPNNKRDDPARKILAVGPHFKFILRLVITCLHLKKLGEPSLLLDLET